MAREKLPKTRKKRAQSPATRPKSHARPPKSRRKLPKGWTEGTVGDLLDLTEHESALVEMRVRLAERVREKRRSRRMSQEALALRIGSTQPRIARLEQADASLEMLIRALFALGSDRKEIGKLLAA